MSTKEKLIIAGLEELKENGYKNFSTRRVAKICGLSYNAPYKHFTDTKDFISEILGYENNIFMKKWTETRELVKNLSKKEQLVKISMTFVDFLVEHPIFRSVIMNVYRNVSPEYKCLRGQVSNETMEIIDMYCDDVKMTQETKQRKIFVVRSLIYTAAMLFENGDLEYNKDNLQMVENMLRREFDLP